MADSAVPITAGSGTNIDSRTEDTNGNERQVVVIGDPSSNTGVAPVDGTTGLKVNLGADNDVSVTGTVDLGATDNAVLDAIAAATIATQAAVEALDNAIAGSELQVDVVNEPTVALSATDNAVLDNIQTAVEAVQAAVEILDNAISGTEMQVDVVAPLPAGTNKIGDVGIDGEPTVALSATDNAVLDTIAAATAATQAAVEALDNAIAGSELQVDVVNEPTVNLGATDNAVLDDIAQKLGDIETAVQLLDDAISGSEMQVDVVGPLPAGTNNLGKFSNDILTDIGAGEYETVAASQTDQALGATGATGDFLNLLLIVPATTSPGAVSIKDGAGSAITVFTGGTDSVSNLVPFTVSLGLLSGAGAWQVTTGANVSVLASGNFT